MRVGRVTNDGAIVMEMLRANRFLRIPSNDMPDDVLVDLKLAQWLSYDVEISSHFPTYFRTNRSNISIEIVGWSMTVSRDLYDLL